MRRQRQHTTHARQETDRAGWRFESEELENASFFLDDAALNDPLFHDGWSAVRPRPRGSSAASPAR